MAGSKKAIIQTLLYSTLFDFPLTEDEIYYYLQSDTLISKTDFKKSFSSLKNILVTNGSFYTLKGFERSIELRRKRKLISEKKRQEGFKIARYLGYIPTILFIGLSGSVAVENADETDDIDFFVVTTNGSLYTTRLLILIILQVLGRRRKRNELRPHNKACVNMLVDQDGMYLKNSHDLYTARELVQLYPLFERDGYYQKLLKKNSWTRSFMPHAVGHRNEFLHKKTIFLQSFSFLEFICRILEQKLIKRNQTREIVTNHVIALHPFDTKNKVLIKVKEHTIHYSKYYTDHY